MLQKNAVLISTIFNETHMRNKNLSMSTSKKYRRVEGTNKRNIQYLCHLRGWRWDREKETDEGDVANGRSSKERRRAIFALWRRVPPSYIMFRQLN
jgi:hypothetical protein